MGVRHVLMVSRPGLQLLAKNCDQSLIKLTKYVDNRSHKYLPSMLAIRASLPVQTLCRKSIETTNYVSRAFRRATHQCEGSNPSHWWVSSPPCSRRATHRGGPSCKVGRGQFPHSIKLTSSPPLQPHVNTVVTAMHPRADNC